MSLQTLLLCLVTLLPSAFAAGVTNEQLELEKEGLQLIGRLNSYAGSLNVSTWTHDHRFDHIKSFVKDGLRPAPGRLEEIQPKLPEWK